MFLLICLLLCVLKFAHSNNTLVEGGFLPWLIQLEMRSADESKIFMGSLIAYRSVVTCCWCVTPINPKIQTMHRRIHAELETIEARAAGDSSFTTYQIRFAMQTVVEASCVLKKRKVEKNLPPPTDQAYIAVVILDLAFIWNGTFNYPRMPLPDQDTLSTWNIDQDLKNMRSCWCQSQLYNPFVGADFLSRLLYIDILSSDVIVKFPNTSARTQVDPIMSPVIRGAIITLNIGSVNRNSSSNKTKQMYAGSPLICDSKVVGVLTITGTVGYDNEFLRFDYALAFVNEFLSFARYFPSSATDSRHSVILVFLYPSLTVLRAQ